MQQKEGGPTNDVTGDLGGHGRTYWHHRYTVLFYILFVTMVAAPILSALKFNGTLIETLLAACLLAAISPVGA